MIDHASRQMQDVCVIYNSLTEDHVTSPMPIGAEAIGPRLRDPPFHSYGAEGEYTSADEGSKGPRVPPEAAYQEALEGIMDVVETQLVDYPPWRKRLLWVLVHQFGANDRPVEDSDQEETESDFRMAEDVRPSAGGQSSRGRNGSRSSPSLERA